MVTDEKQSVSNIHNVVISSIATTVIKLNSLFILIMNTEMNNNSRKKHSKTLAIAGMGFLLIKKRLHSLLLILASN